MIQNIAQRIGNYFSVANARQLNVTDVIVH